MKLKCMCIAGKNWTSMDNLNSSDGVKLATNQSCLEAAKRSLRGRLLFLKIHK